MKTLFSFFASSFFISLSFAQFNETYQTDSVYKLNGVKERVGTYRNVRMGIGYIDKYDREGRHIETAHTDTSLINIESKTIFEYDEHGKLIKEYVLAFRKKDSITKEYFLSKDAPFVSPSLKIEYDSLNRVTKKTRKSQDGFILDESAYTYSPLTIKEIRFRQKDSAIKSISETIYENVNVSKRRFGHTSFKGEISFFDISYENTFDKSGNLIKRVGGKTDTSCNCFNNATVASEIIYEYNTNGLLIKRTENSNYKNRKVKTVLVFDYKYW